MTRKYVGFLRSVNVGGTGKLPMSDLVRMCQDIGFSEVQTYIASGNVLFSTAMERAAAQRALEARLLEYCGKTIRVHLRTPEELQDIAADNPFADQAGNKVAVILLDTPPDQPETKGQKDEEIATGTRELYVHYPEGMGRSKLVIAGTEQGTARNMNTIAKLVTLI
ncbi:DUF1697 domain-containing protein [Donghicola sp. C2-DW-16]|uniref:DUF1697 domain-containing protein n=1 Tax=Donghicola mangrovi TaxID=2729614 RepID=A0ABX2PDA0_9RHOB|nr:DUF1697 domain-containing protein [Donghicola mangrovi]NVO26644.1 DUF1697 domain-containing protein [Donghicola mangrovi]